jgi:hypothetical protein
MSQSHRTPGVIGVEVAIVKPEPPDRKRMTKHTWGLPGQAVLMPWPAVLVLEASATDAMLYRYSATREFGGDTWHQSVADAKDQVSRSLASLLGSSSASRA